MTRQSHALYFHVPFCVHRCAYCDFNTYAGQEQWIPAYVEALAREVRLVARSAPDRLEAGTIFFGGGTPSLLTPAQFATIFDAVRESFDLAKDAEISLEANPGTLDRQSLDGLRRVGFNRISLGVQSTHPEELRLLERIHDYADVVAAVTWARQAGFANLNLDLIFGLPEQTLERWQTTVEHVLGLHPEHLSLYALTLEHGTPFGRWAQRGLLPLPDPDRAADMYEWVEGRLEQAGYIHYEISNWSLPGRECRHNLVYWRNRPYLGFGAGAHGFAGGLRYSNALRIRTYIDRIVTDTPSAAVFPVSPAAVNRQPIARETEMQETMMTGLRLTQEGVPEDEFLRRFGVDLSDVFGKDIDQLVRQGLLERVDGRLRLTRRGHLLGNQVFMHFVE
jgi:oxygen-independent coproporphyrinogen III oxidase